jgi:hypothetical protein
LRRGLEDRVSRRVLKTTIIYPALPNAVTECMARTIFQLSAEEKLAYERAWRRAIDRAIWAVHVSLLTSLRKPYPYSCT